MAHTARAAALLREIELAHARLIDRAEAGGAVRHALRAVHDAIAAGLDGIDDDRLDTTPDPEEWSMAEVAEHVAQHDGGYAELEHHGVEHYVEHGLEHALQIWRLRARQPAEPRPVGGG
jgi:hypothetical protein